MSRASLLLFHRAVGFVHRSIPDTVAAIERLGADHDLAVTSTDDPAAFGPGSLDGVDVVVFAHTSGDVLPEPAQRRALESFVSGGGGFVGIHAASSMDAGVRDDWPWFVELVGAEFKGHTVARLWCDDVIDSPGVVHEGPLTEAPDDAEWLGDSVAMTSWEPATLRVEDPGCPAADGLADGETRAEEWYGFTENPRPWVNVVATVDETTYEPFLGAMGADHPVIWWRDLDGGGRSVYTSLGHACHTWREPAFLASVLGAIELATRLR